MFSGISRESKCAVNTATLAVQNTDHDWFTISTHLNQLPVNRYIPNIKYRFPTIGFFPNAKIAKTVLTQNSF